MRTALLMLLMLTVGLSPAGAGTRADISMDPESAMGNPDSFEPPRDLVVVWSQVQDFSGVFNAYSSEHKASGYWCYSADDFYSESGDTIVRVDWWGHERDLLIPEVPEIPEFRIQFCEDDTTERYHFPGDVVYEETYSDFTADYIGIIEKYYYSCDLDAGFAPNPGERYWLSIVALHAFPQANQQWYWYDCVTEDYWGGEATHKSDFWGYPSWTPWSYRPYGNYVEHAFILYARGDTQVEEGSWGQIKAMFR